eukprot:TRINITY_DN28901_c0_g1_i1.p3 TRINITY_DN28901_c0_g1~~TRINITY_DN28901_c0_g1_i1.p3  ORF type:complete len:111 (+),score=10.17 TRINITY_DN28901_c0_g1_i1:40-333(+)
MSFDTSFIESTATKGLVDAVLVSLASGDFTHDGDGFVVVNTTYGVCDVNAVSKKRTGLTGTYEGRAISIGDEETDSPFHGTHEQRTALFAQIRSLIG